MKTRAAQEVDILNAEREVGVDAVAELGQHGQRITERSLVSDQQADHAKVGDLAMLGHP